MNGQYNLVENKDQIYFIPVSNKPVKIIFEEYYCPVFMQLGVNYRCQYANSKTTEDLNWTLYCEDIGKCKYFKNCNNSVI